MLDQDLAARYFRDVGFQQLVNHFADLVKEGFFSFHDLFDALLFAHQRAPFVEDGTEDLRGLFNRRLTLKEMEKEYIRHVLDECGGIRFKAAGDLGISERTLYRKLAEFSA